MAAHVQDETHEAEYHLCSNRLPHQYGAVEQKRRFPAATAAEEIYVEEDQSPEAELSDPVPALSRQSVRAADFSAALVEAEPNDCPNRVFSSTSHFGGLRATAA